MAYRSSGGPYYKTTTLSATTKNNLIAGLETALVTNLGWTAISGAGTLDSLVESPATPQGLKARLRLYDYGNANCITIGPRTVSGSRVIRDTGGLGLQYGAGITYTFIGCPWNFVCYTPGTLVARQFYHFFIPWIPSFLEGKIFNSMYVATNMLSDGNATEYWSWRRAGRGTGNQGWIINDKVWDHYNANVQYYSDIRFHVPSVGFNGSDSPVGKWRDGTAFLGDVYVGHSDQALDPYCSLRGQLWDTYWYCEPLPTDTEITIDGLNYRNMNYMNVGPGGHDDQARGQLLMRIP